MTYNVFGGTLSLTQAINQSRLMSLFFFFCSDASGSQMQRFVRLSSRGAVAASEQPGADDSPWPRGEAEAQRRIDCDGLPQ